LDPPPTVRVRIPVSSRLASRNITAVTAVLDHQEFRRANESTPDEGEQEQERIIVASSSILVSSGLSDARMQLIMRIFLRYFSALPVLVVFPSMIGKAASQQSPACAETLADIFFAESAVTDRSVPREYILCEKVYEVGVPDETLGFAGGDFPLVLRSNATAKCGPNGTGDCIIDGSGGVYGIIVR
jgi:hypothetical protein